MLLLVVSVFTALVFIDIFPPGQEWCHLLVLVPIRTSITKLDINDGVKLTISMYEFEFWVFWSYQSNFMNQSYVTIQNLLCYILYNTKWPYYLQTCKSFNHVNPQYRCCLRKKLTPLNNMELLRSITGLELSDPRPWAWHPRKRKMSF